METKRNDGGQAFPCIELKCGDNAIGSGGMTLRDWFAGQALTGMLGNSAMMDGFGNSKDVYDWCVLNSYGIADAMLKARAE